MRADCLTELTVQDCCCGWLRAIAGNDPEQGDAWAALIEREQGRCAPDAHLSFESVINLDRSRLH